VISARPFDPADALVLEGVFPTLPTIGLTVERDGQPVGYFGVWKVNGRTWGFLHITDAMRSSMKATVARTVRECLDALAREGVHEIFTVCEEKYPRARAFMEWLGFVCVPDNEKTEDIRAYETAARGAPAWVRRA
jgi:hypothetical protein